MIYSLKHQFVFIHIPRTGGTSITETLAGQCWDATVDVFELKHATAEDLRVRFLSDVWHSLYRFTVVRNPWDIIASDYRHTLMAAEQIDARTSLYCTAEWMARMRRVLAYRDFSKFVRNEYLGEYSYLKPGGFWRTFCQGADDEDLGVEPLRFEELDVRWPEVCRRCGVAPCCLPHVNQTRGRKLQYSPSLCDDVGAFCHLDVDRFSFAPLEDVEVYVSPDAKS